MPEPKVVIDTTLMLRTQPMYSCCAHCKAAYCPDREGHYVPCPMRGCVHGHTEIKRKKE